MNEFVKHGGDHLIPCYSDILGAVLPCISDKEKEIREVLLLLLFAFAIFFCHLFFLDVICISRTDCS